MHAVSGSTTFESPSLRVRHTYIDGKGRMVVLADGGVWQDDPALTPRSPVWFKVDVANLASEKNGLITLPQSALIPGSPDLAQLAQEGFVEIPFAEDARPRNRNAPPPPETSYVEVIYSNGMTVAKNFPEQLGHDPLITVQNNSGTPDNPVQLLDEKTESHPAAIILLPVAFAADLVTFPFLVILVVASGVH